MNVAGKRAPCGCKRVQCGNGCMPQPGRKSVGRGHVREVLGVPWVEHEGGVERVPQPPAPQPVECGHRIALLQGFDYLVVPTLWRDDVRGMECERGLYRTGQGAVWPQAEALQQSGHADDARRVIAKAQRVEEVQLAVFEVTLASKRVVDGAGTTNAQFNGDGVDADVTAPCIGGDIAGYYLWQCASSAVVLTTRRHEIKALDAKLRRHVDTSGAEGTMGDERAAHLGGDGVCHCKHVTTQCQVEVVNRLVVVDAPGSSADQVQRAVMGLSHSTDGLEQGDDGRIEELGDGVPGHRGLWLWSCRSGHVRAAVPCYFPGAVDAEHGSAPAGEWPGMERWSVVRVAEGLGMGNRGGVNDPEGPATARNDDRKWWSEGSQVRKELR